MTAMRQLKVTVLTMYKQRRARDNSPHVQTNKQPNKQVRAHACALRRRCVRRGAHTRHQNGLPHESMRRSQRRWSCMHSSTHACSAHAHTSRTHAPPHRRPHPHTHTHLEQHAQTNCAFVQMSLGAVSKACARGTHLSASRTLEGRSLAVLLRTHVHVHDDICMTHHKRD